MKNLIIVILLFIGYASAQTYHPVNLHVEDSIKVGTSANSVWWTNMFAGSWIQTSRELDYTMDGSQEYTDTIVYYVDESAGSNANTGLSTGQAWETLAYANTNARIPTNGDTIVIIALDPRDDWSITSTLDITTSGTSNDARVIWDGSNASWSQPGDTATIIKTGTQVHHIQFRTVRYVTFQNILLDGVDSLDTGIQIEPILTTDFAEFITIQGCDIFDFKHGIYISCDSVNSNAVLVYNNYVHRIGWHGLAVYKSTPNTGPGTNNLITLSTNTIIDYFTTFPTPSGQGIIVRNQSDSVTIEYNTIENEDGDIQGAILVEQATSGGGRYSTNLVIRYNVIDVTDNMGMQFDNGDAVTAEIYGNIIKTTDSYAGFTITNSDDWTGAVINIFNNTFVVSGENFGIAMGSYPNLTMAFRNNIVYSNDGNQCLSAGNIPGFTHNNNGYFKTGSTYTANWVTFNSSNYANAGAVQGWEATSQVTDPTFTVNFANLNLQTGSDAIDNGTAITGYTEDRQGVAVVNPPNIGQSETTED